MSSPEQTRKIVEAHHARTPIGQEFEKLRTALGTVSDKGSVIRIASEVLDSEPDYIDGMVRIGKFEFGFSADDKLESLSNWCGGITIRSAKPDRR